MKPQASIIIPHYGDDQLLRDCLTALWANTGSLFELVVVDNNRFNRGFAGGCNHGAAKAHGDVLVFLNNDCQPHHGWLPPLLDTLTEDHVGVVGSKLLYPNGTVQHAGVELFNDARGVLTAAHAPAALADTRRDVPAVTGACLAIRRDVFLDSGGFDEGYWNGYEDVDLCLTAGAAGWRVVYEPASVLTHLESQGGPERWRRVRQNIHRLQEKWADAGLV